MIRGRYDVLGVLGAGTQGTAFEVTDRLFENRRLVLKLFAPHEAESALASFDLLTQLASPFLPVAQGLFVINEADVQAFSRQSNHQLTTEVHVRAGQACLVRGAVDGEPANRWVEGRSWKTRSLLLWRMASLIAELHRADYLHGDLKPDHVLVSDDGMPVFIDFGLSQQPAEAIRAGGTPLYMAPELFRGSPHSTAAERYSFGALAFALLAGQPPFRGTTLAEVARGHIEGAIPALPDDVPRRLATLVAQLLSKAPDERPEMEDVVARLRPGGVVQLPRPVLPFVGRSAELSTTLERLDRGHSTWVAGPAGMGKSRLLRRTRWRAEADGWTTLQAPDGRLSLADKLTAVGRQLAGLAGIRTPPLPTSSGDRLHQLRAYGHWLDGLTPTTPPVLFWDDADLLPDHFDFVDDYMRHGGQLPLIASASSVASDAQSVLLQPLDAVTLSEAAGRTAETDKLSPQVVSAAVRRAQGNPRALELALRDLSGRAERLSTDETAQLDELEARIVRALGSSPIALSVPLLASALRIEADQVVDQLRRLSSSGTVARIGGGYALARPLARLTVSTDPLTTTLVEIAASLLRAGQHREANVLTVLSGDVGHAAVKAAYDGLLELRRDHFALHLLGAVVNAGQSKWVRPLIALAQKTDRVDVAISYLPVDPVPDDDGAGLSPDLRLVRARMEYMLGQLETASSTLESLVGSDLDNEMQAELAALRAWVALRGGRPSDAVEIAERAGSVDGVDSSSPIAAELATARAAALLLSGHPAADAQLDLARRALRRAGGMPRLAARLLSFQARAATRRGDLKAAQHSHDEALRLVESAELDADLPVYLLNAATAHDHKGDLTKARELYRRGLNAAATSTPLYTRVLLRANLANISLRLCRLDEAAELLDEVVPLAADSDAGRAADFVAQLRAELAQRAGRHEEALRSFSELATTFEAAGDRFGHAEVLLLGAMAANNTGQLELAQTMLGRANGLISSHGLNDLRTLALIVHGHLETNRDRGASAVQAWNEAIGLGNQHGDPFRVIEAAEALLTHQPLTVGQVIAVERALRLVVGGLDARLKQRYLEHRPAALRGLVSTSPTGTVRADAIRTRHNQDAHVSALPATTTADRSPDLVRLAATSAAFDGTASPGHRVPQLKHGPFASQEPAGSQLEERLFRLLSLTARLARQETDQALLGSAIDMAIELSGSERGFLLLRDGDHFRVAVSRDVDGEPIRRAILKVSITIAERVASQGEPLSTVDAQADDRLALARSVTDLKLTSILCVPIRTFGDVIGVLYLDHRFRAGVYQAQTIRLVSAFADQLAVALLYLDRVKTLKQKNRELEQANQRVEELLADKQQMTDVLEARCMDLESSLRTQRQSAPLQFRYDEIVASTPAMMAVLHKVDRVVDSSIPVLISGESGTGKELVARAIHYNSRRAQQAFVPINCGAIPENLLESELFGHKKGAFTGADRDHPGLLVSADGGTVFLDEIGELPLQAQVKLLRAVQEKRVRPVGGLHDREIDVRLVGATNRDLHQMVGDGSFRTDLYYRLAGMELDLPPLRERREDIPLLVRRFVQNLPRHADPNATIDIDPTAMSVFYEFDWPGNIRQLQNVLQASHAISDGLVIRAADVRPLLRSPITPASTSAAVRAPQRKSGGRRGPKPKVKREDVVHALRQCAGDIDAAAELLEVTPRSVYRYMNKWGIDLS